MVRLYGIPGCGPCEIVKMFLSMKGVPFVFVDARKDPQAAQRITELVGSPTAGVVLEVDGEVEAIRGVTPARLEAWYRAYLERSGSR
ncbi:glutaredoxin family protein [Thermus filiformis]|jgi:glutaredoxin|uniref:Glutaredoxin n=1 Tax=Thermus filiformis TaxID=276 RepID=A0A0D6XBC2_THEFI|nr:glutaredoxin family protein [Thermus filiformis]KIX84631.1 glutaredoxin [Thermus filiformis]